MRPCSRCLFALGNDATICPRCGAAQGDGPHANADDPSSEGTLPGQFVQELFDGLPLEVAGPVLGLAAALIGILLLSLR